MPHAPVRAVFSIEVVTVRVPCSGCGHDKASHRPHGGKRVPRSRWVCRKRDCDCADFVLPDGTPLTDALDAEETLKADLGDGYDGYRERLSEGERQFFFGTSAPPLVDRDTGDEA